MRTIRSSGPHLTVGGSFGFPLPRAAGGINVASNIERTKFRDHNQSIGGPQTHQPSRPRKIALPAPARAQSRGLVRLGG